MTDVSRETSLAEHYATVPGLARFVEILSTRGVERGLVGPREVPRMWTRHVANCAVVAQEERARLPIGARVADVGSGAGLPGIVWAVVRSDLEVTLIEPLLRRATFLSEVIEELDLGQRVRVERSRAEDVHGTFPVVTARAVARLPQLLGWTVPMTEVGGWVVALKGAGARDEVAEAQPALQRLGCGAPEICEYGAELLDRPTTAVLVPRVGSGAPEVRRPSNVIRKHSVSKRGR